MPDAQIDWVVEDRSASLLTHRPDLDRVVVFPRTALSGAFKGVPEPLALGQETADFVGNLRRVRYDLILDIQGNLKSGSVARLARSAHRYGYGRGTAREGNHLFRGRRWTPPASIRHRVDLALGLASAAVGEALPYVSPGFPTSPETEMQAHDLLERAGVPLDAYVVLQPDTSGFGSFKRWAPERFGALAARLCAEGLAVVVTHGPGFEGLAETVATSSGGPVAVIAPPSFDVLAEIIRHARLFVAADTGPLHVAALVETPLVGLFGPKDPAIYGPYGVRADGTAGVLTTVVQEDVACRPCTLRRCADPLCMRTMDPDRVFDVAKALIAP